MTARRGSVAILLLLILALPLHAEKDVPRATILCYHIVESPSDTKFTLARSTYRMQMDYLASAGFNVIPLAHLSEYIQGKRKTLPPNAVVVTIDDGWKCTYTHIYPEMKRHRFPFTVFIYPKFIGQSGYALSWKEVKEMSDNGVDIQSHSYSHPFLTQRRHRSFGDDYYSDWLTRELKESKAAIEKKTGKPVKFLAYPYGDYDTRVVEAASESGYEAAVTAEFGSVTKQSDPLRLRRVVIESHMSFAEFRRLMGASSMKIESPTPAAGTLLAADKPVVSAKIAEFKSLDPTSVGMTLVGTGVVPFSYNPADGTISTVIREPLSANRQQVIVWGRDSKTGKRKEATWVFYANELPQKPKPVTPPAAPASEPAVASGSDAVTQSVASSSAAAAPREQKKRK